MTTHTITVTVVGRNMHGEDERSSVEIAGDGSLDHHLQAYVAALVASGFATDTAAKLLTLEG